MLFILYYISICIAIGFEGVISNVPSIDPLPIPNGKNYQARFKIDLYKLNDRYNNVNFDSRSAIVDKSFRFKYTDVAPGEYELIVNSYDFTLNPNRFKIDINEESAFAYIPTQLNQTQIDITKEALVINVVETNQFYEKSSSSIQDVLINSPFGFIFKNKVYTIVFTVCVGIMIAPYILQWVNPEFAEQLKEIQVQQAQSRVEKVITKEPIEVLDKEPPKSNMSKVQKRKS